jgi:hypothetical protein
VSDLTFTPIGLTYKQVKSILRISDFPPTGYKPVVRSYLDVKMQHSTRRASAKAYLVEQEISPLNPARSIHLRIKCIQGFPSKSFSGPNFTLYSFHQLVNLKMSNYVVVTSKEQFQDALQADLTRVSVLNFRADWAEPCKTMFACASFCPGGLLSAGVGTQLRRNWRIDCPSCSFFRSAQCCRLNEIAQIKGGQIEAEDLPDISETFDVESVPHFVVLRGHTLLDQVSGANASQLTKTVEKHAGSKPATQALSKTDQLPQKAPARTANGASTEEEQYAQDPAPANETDEELEERCQKVMNMVCLPLD